MKNSIILIFFLLFSIKNQAQTLDFLRFGGSTTGTGSASGTTTSGDSDGNIYVAGTTSGGVQSFDDENAISGYENFLVKYNSSGSVLWLKKITGGGISQIYASDNAVYLTGYMTQSGINFNSPSSPDNVLYTSANKCFFIAKFDFNGNFLWAKTSTASYINSANGIAVSNNSVYITGKFSSFITFNNTTINSAGEYDIFLAKYDDLGNFQWARRAGSSNTNVIVNDEGLKLATSGNSVYLTGTFNGTANFNTPSSSGTNELISVGSYNGFVAKFDDLGTFIWAKRFGGNAVTDIVTNGTSVYISGNFQNTINFSNPYVSGVNQVSTGHNYMALFLAKFDENGNYQWAKTAHRNYISLYKCKVELYQNEVFFAGDGPVNFDNTINYFPYGNIFLAKYDENGVKQWHKEYQGNLNFGTPFNDFCITSNAVFFTGTFQNSFYSSSGFSFYATNNIAFFLFKTDLAGTAIWLKNTNSTIGGDDQANATTTDNVGNVYITGKFKGTMVIGGSAITSMGSDDIFIAKYDNSGNLLWAKRAGGTGADVGLGIAFSQNSIYITGSFTGTANFNNPALAGSNEIVSAGWNDIFVAKYNENGEFQWANRAGGGGDNDYGNGIAVFEKSVYITGSFIGRADFNNPSAEGSNEILSEGGAAIFVAKFDGDGNFQWANRAGGEFSAEARCISVTEEFVYIAGNYIGTINFNNPSESGYNELTTASNDFSEAFIAKYDSGGSFVWAKNGGGGTNNGIAATENDVYTTGTALLAKYDIDGNILWSKGYTGESSHSIKGTGITVSESSIFITGLFTGQIYLNSTNSCHDNINNGSLSTGTSTSDIFVAKYNSSGDFQWTKRGGGTSNDAGLGIATFGNALYITGYFSETANFNTPSASGSNEISSIGGTDIFLAKYNFSTITITSNLVPFSVCKNQTSPIQSYTVLGENLTANIIITAPSGFEISKFTETEEYYNSVTITPINGSINYKTILVRMKSNAEGNPTGMINHSGSYAEQNLEISGVVHKVPIPTAQSNMPICSGLTLNLSANGGTNYAWTGPNSFSSILQNPIISNVSNSLSGSYTVLATDANGCSATTSTQVIIINTPSLSIISNAPLSTGNTLRLYTMGGVNYQWRGPNGFVSTQQNPFIKDITAVNAGNYQVTITDGNGCVVNTSINIEISNNANCPDNISLNNIENTPNTIIYSTKGSITSISTITSNAKVTYDAGKSVILNPGFAVNNGAVFNAKIGGCGNN